MTLRNAQTLLGLGRKICRVLWTFCKIRLILRQNFCEVCRLWNLAYAGNTFFGLVSTLTSTNFDHVQAQISRPFPPLEKPFAEESPQDSHPADEIFAQWIRGRPMGRNSDNVEVQ